MNKNGKMHGFFSLFEFDVDVEYTDNTKSTRKEEIIMAKTDRKLLKIVCTGLMAALVFAASQISFTLPAIAGTPTRIHLGNTMCLLAGLLFGGVSGGLSAGIGSMCYDFTNPLYIPSAPITFITKFMMGFVCGLVARKNTRSFPRSIVAAVLGQLTYIVLYLGKAFIENMLVGNALETTLVVIGQKAVASGVNAVIAVAVAVPLSFAIRKALVRVPAFSQIMMEKKEN